MFCEQCEQSVSMLTNFINTTCKMLNVFCERLLNFWISWLNANCKNIKQEKIKVSVLVDNQRANLDTGWERREVRRMIRFDVISCFWMMIWRGFRGSHWQAATFVGASCRACYSWNSIVFVRRKLFFWTVARCWIQNRFCIEKLMRTSESRFWASRR